ncbi:MAG: hypothetical protein KA603_01575 [Azonexus sp.]|nr:hypothetical protein [Betaproteobacteria bacterium]MBP6034810.1 hypothetical protein [Azonexus sp.]MBP6905350.1 hypothetical protein [Azonexus sp.]
MSGAAKKILIAVAFVVGFVAVRHFMQRQDERTAAGAAQRTVEELQQKGAEKHPGQPLSAAMQQEAVAMAESKLSEESDQGKRLMSAASMFYGFYLVNTRERVQFCREQGVDIAAFVEPFAAAHAAELQKARAALAGQVTEEKLYGMVQSQLRTVVVQDMKDIAAQSQTDAKGACEIIAANGPAVAAEMHIAKTQPAVHRALLGTD